MHSHDRPTFLLIEDNKAYARAIAKVLSKWGDVTVVESVLEGRHVTKGGRWDAIVSDVALPDGSGLVLVELLLKARPGTAVLVISGEPDENAIARAHKIGADYAVKPVSSALLEAFARSAAPMRKRVANIADSWRERYGLSGAERDVLARAAAGESYDEMASGRGSSPETVRTQVRALLKKTGHDSLQVLASEVLRELANPAVSKISMPPVARS
jgi:DNA-binding NarL/FixJ family response regulator